VVCCISSYEGMEQRRASERRRPRLSAHGEPVSAGDATRLFSRGIEQRLAAREAQCLEVAIRKLTRLDAVFPFVELLIIRASSARALFPRAKLAAFKSLFRRESYPRDRLRGDHQKAIRKLDPYGISGIAENCKQRPLLLERPVFERPWAHRRSAPRTVAFNQVLV